MVIMKHLVRWVILESSKATRQTQIFPAVLALLADDSMRVVTSWEESTVNMQAALFEAESLMPADMGFRGPIASRAAGISYRQLDYWARTGLVTPQIRAALGSGTQRLYSFQDILMLKVVKKLLDAGVTLQQIRIAITHLRRRGVEDLTSITLMSDGVSVYECTTDNEVIDLLKGGQGMFAIAIGGVWRDIEGTLATLPTQRAEDDMDELAKRRAAKQARLAV